MAQNGPRTRNASLTGVPNREVVLHCTDRTIFQGCRWHMTAGPQDGTEVSPGSALRLCDCATTAAWLWYGDGTPPGWAVDVASCGMKDGRLLMS